MTLIVHLSLRVRPEGGLPGGRLGKMVLHKILGVSVGCTDSGQNAKHTHFPTRNFQILYQFSDQKELQNHTHLVAHTIYTAKVSKLAAPVNTKRANSGPILFLSRGRPGQILPRFCALVHPPSFTTLT